MFIVTNFLPVCLLLFSAISVSEITCEKDTTATVERDAAGGIDIDLHIYVPTEEVKHHQHQHEHHHHKHHKDHDHAKTSTHRHRNPNSEESDNVGTNEQTIEVYKDEELKGGSETIILKKNKCHNLSAWLNDKISSIDTNGEEQLSACIVVWEHADCNGRHARIRPDSTYSSRKLHNVRMNDEVSSLELC